MNASGIHSTTAEHHCGISRTVASDTASGRLPARLWL